MNLKRLRLLFWRWIQSLGFSTFLTTLLVIAKLTHHLAWTWLWIVSPIWLHLAFTLSLPILGLLGMGFISVIAWLLGGK